MSTKFGEAKNIFYFNVCGQVNTEKALALAIQRARELEINKLVVASETGLSALKAAEMLQDSKISLIVVTSAADTKVEDTVIGDLKIGIQDREVWHKLEKSGAEIVRSTDPLYSIGAVFEQQGVPTLATTVRLCLKMISAGTSVCVAATLMATDNGLLKEGEEVVAVAGSWVGLDTALVVRAANSVNLFKRGVMQIREIICKPKNPAYSWSVDQKDWVGDLEPYKRFAEG